MFKVLKCWMGAAILFLGASAALAATEEILTFESRMTVHADASITVIETIDVIATGAQIKRGIFRDFPTTYKTRGGDTIQAGFKVLGVRRDGQTIDFWVEKKPNAQRIYMGNRDLLINPGPYRYELTYKTDRQIGYYEKFDEIYWNATGDQWMFPIRKAIAIVRLPTGAHVVQQAAYTGPPGSTAQNFTTSAEPDGGPRFTTTRALAPGQGLTIAVAWPKGFVNEPENQALPDSVLGFNLILVLAFIGLIIVFSYYIIVWHKIGRDPVTGPIIPLFDPPKGLSPAAAHYALNMGFSDTAFSSAVVSLAVKGALIIEDHGQSYNLAKKPWQPKTLSKGEKALLGVLFKNRTEILLDQSNHEIIGGARNALNRKIDDELEGVLFNTNKPFLMIGIVLSAVVTVAILLMSSLIEDALFISLFLGAWTFGCSGLILKAIRSWKKTTRDSSSFVPSLFLSLFAVPFLIGEVFGILELAAVVSLPVAILLALIFVQTPLFRYLLMAPTYKGRSLMDQIEGFKLYLSVAEHDLMNFKHPPEKTPELFETYLPYALALGVGHQWSEKFSNNLRFAGTGPNDSYQPDWYSGSSWEQDEVSRFSKNLENSFSDALASSSHAPQSRSSGSGGGGFSGGGGGGGGGGGF